MFDVNMDIGDNWISFIKVKKPCKICNKEFETYFPNRMVCNDCLLLLLGVKKGKIELDGDNLKLWENDS